jgi:hypothetical protein
MPEEIVAEAVAAEAAGAETPAEASVERTASRPTDPEGDR